MLKQNNAFSLSLLCSWCAVHSLTFLVWGLLTILEIASCGYFMLQFPPLVLLLKLIAFFQGSVLIDGKTI